MSERIITINVKPVGNTCNIRCVYCDVDHNLGNPSFHLVRYLAEIKRIQPCFDFVHIVFHGGEPLLASPELLEEIIIKTKRELFGKCDFQIQTNGLCLTNDVLLFLRDNECKLSISFDPLNENLRYDRNKYLVVKEKIYQAVLFGLSPGILSVAHSCNHPFFLDFMKTLTDIGIKYWTVNKIRVAPQSPFFLSEAAYLELLLQLTQKWIECGLFQKLSIQPIMDLLSSEKNHSCHFCPDIKKCTCFSVFSGQEMISHCEHYSDKFQSLFEKCKTCDIFTLCGGGCPTDLRNEEFCDSRRLFFSTLQQLKHQIGVL